MSSNSAVIPSDQVCIELYPVLDGYVGHLKLTPEVCAKVMAVSNVIADQSSVETVVLLDRSMSMGGQTKRLVNQVFPQVLQRLNASPDAKMTIVAFDDEAVFMQATAEELTKSDLRARGGTLLSTGLRMLGEYLVPDSESEAKDTPAPAPAAAGSSSSQKKKLMQENVFSSLDDPLRRPSRELRPDEPLLIEVAFIVDCTASMGSWIQTVHETVFKLVEQVKLECQTTRDISPRVRIAFVAYRDFCDGEHMRFATLDFTEDVAAFKRWVLANAGAYGGDDVPEDVFGGLDKALKLSWSSDAQARIALLVADAPCHWHNHGDSSLSLAFPDPFRDPELQQQLLEAFALKRINLSFTRINAQTDAMITRFQEHYYNEQLCNKPIKVLQLGQRVERFLPSVLGMITSSVAGADGTSPIVPTTTRKPSKQLRLLVLSDGEIEDMHTTLLAASELQNKIVRSGYTVNAQAIRFFTSAEQPDTRGLSAVLQFNTLVPAQLVDIDGLTQSNDGLVEQIVRLVEQDGLSQSHTLSVSAGDALVLQSTPWEVPQTSLVLTPGSNTFWLPNMPVKMLMLDGHVSVTVKLADGRFDEETYARILGAKIDYFMQKLRVLKVVGGDATSAKLNEMLAYFERLDKFVATEQAQTLVAAASASAGSVKITPNSIRSRMIALQVELARKKTSVSMRMKEIANDARIGLLNAKQAAEFLRNVGAESKAIARRADKAGLDVDGMLSTEMAAIADHIHELDDLSDDDHVKSLYSQETTLGGLRAVAELAQKERLNLAEISADSILLLLNIVGVACKAPIGGFPDPMTYRIDRMFLSSPLSLSDILQAHLQSGGVTPLTALGSTQPDRDTIDNVVPVFDDERLHHFYRKYAPKLLEMHASVGMRRLVTMVNMTHSYTIVAGVWSMVFELNREAPGKRTELQARMWINLLDTFRVAIGDYFKHVLPHVRKPATPIEQDKLTGPASFYLLNNGITNAISPLMTWIKDQGGLIACANIGAILRALYTFEIRQAIKRFVKKQVPENERDKTDVHAAQLLRQLLGIDISRYKTKVPALFDEAAAAVSPLLHDQVIVDDNLLDKMLDEFWYLDHVCLLPLLIEAALIPSTAALRIAACNAVPTLDDALCHKMLELPPTMTLRQFKLLNIVQAIRFPTKASRIDHVNECMKIPDLAHKMAAEADLCAFVRKHYEDAYSSDMQLRRKEERNLLMEELIEQMVKAPDMATFCSLFRQGLSRGGTKVVIDTPAALGYVELRQALLARPPNSFAIPDHIEKAAVLLLGCQRSGSGSGDKSPVWNNGRTLYLSDISVYDESFASADEWQELKRQHRDLYKHVYRNGKPNHQGHSNKKPSYWALGYATLYDFERNASANEIADYRSKHTACCGLGSATKLKARKAAIRAMLEREV